MQIKQLFIFLLIISTAALPISVCAADSGIALSKDVAGNNKGNEYVSGDYPGAVMMKINLWGSVQKPGIHYVPAKTDLITLLSYAGGPTEKARSDDVIIKRTIAGKQTVIPVDVEDLISSTKKTSPALEANDIIMVPSKNPVFSDNTVQVIGVVGGILGIVLASLVLKKEFAH